MLKLVSDVLQRFLLVWLVLSSLLAYLWPGMVSASSLDPFLASEPYLPGLITVTMFCLGSLLPVEEVRRLLRQLPLVALGTVTQCIVMPLAAFAVVSLWELEGGYRLGVILVGCVPGAMASNVLTLAAGGNVSYSVSLTTLATILSPLSVPLLLTLLVDEIAEFHEKAMMQSLLLTVVIPVIVGYGLARVHHHVERIASVAAPIAANLAILWIIATVVSLNRERLGSIPVVVLMGLVLINLVGYAGGYAAGFVARLPESMRRALTLEVGMQNAGLGTVIAVDTFGDRFPEAAIPTAVYTFGCMLTGTALAGYWRSSAPKDDQPKPAQSE